MDEDDKTKPQTAKEFFARGVARLALEDFDGAIADFTQAIERKGDFFEAYTNRGLSKTHKGDFDSAVEGFMEAVIHSTRRTLRFAKLYEKYNKDR